ncbi:MAG: MFS transporter, partial [Candidatus Latescibacteria bacterium]|nr:MFS transporter [Candidatus Latescibacterota bacterium]
ALAILFALGIQGMVTLLIFQVARGFAHSGILLETPVLAKHAFGPFHLGKVIGTLSALAGVGLTLGPITIAKFFDIYGNYNIAFWLLGIIMTVCAVVIYLVPPEYRLKMQREQAKPGHAEG